MFVPGVSLVVFRSVASALGLGSLGRRSTKSEDVSHVAASLLSSLTLSLALSLTLSLALLAANVSSSATLSRLWGDRRRREHADEENDEREEREDESHDIHGHDAADGLMKCFLRFSRAEFFFFIRIFYSKTEISKNKISNFQDGSMFVPLVSLVVFRSVASALGLGSLGRRSTKSEDVSHVAASLLSSLALSLALTLTLSLALLAANVSSSATLSRLSGDRRRREHADEENDEREEREDESHDIHGHDAAGG